MYDRDVPIINAHARASADNLADVILFTVLSIRQPFFKVPGAIKDVRTRGARSQFLWGWKADSYAFLQANKVDLWERACAAETAEDCIAVLTDVPGLGVVKAGFVAQMLGHDVACIDTRNCQTLGLPQTAFRFPKTLSEAARRDRICGYVEFTRRTGGARQWWDNWCAGLANAAYTAEDVSALHVAAIGAA